MLTDAVEAGVGAGENEDAAGWLLTIHAGDEIETVSLGHVDIAEKEIGGKNAGTIHGFIGRVDGARDESMLLEDQTKCIWVAEPRKKDYWRTVANLRSQAAAVWGERVSHVSEQAGSADLHGNSHGF